MDLEFDKDCWKFIQSLPLTRDLISTEEYIELLEKEINRIKNYMGEFVYDLNTA